MKQAIVHPGTTVQVIDTPIPVPHADQVVIKVACSGCNPKGMVASTTFCRLVPEDHVLMALLKRLQSARMDKDGDEPG